MFEDKNLQVDKTTNPPISNVFNYEKTETPPIASEEIASPSPESLRVASRRIDVDYAFKTKNSSIIDYDNDFVDLKRHVYNS